MRFMSAATAAALIAASLIVTGSIAQAQKASDLVIETGNGVRHALMVPGGKGPRPTVIVLHGTFGSGAGAAAATGFAEAATRHGFTAVFPDGLARQWHAGKTAEPNSPDDIAFMHALVALLIADRAADPHRIYLAGISNGGMMSFALACKEADLYAGIGTIIANMPADIEPCRPKPIPVVMVNGTADPVIPFAGGEIGRTSGRGKVWSVDQTVALFARVDGCRSSKSAALPHRSGAEDTHVTRIDWSNCQAGTSVTLFRVEGGGHAQPGRHARAAHALGPGNQDFIAADAIMDVFANDARQQHVMDVRSGTR